MKIRMGFVSNSSSSSFIIAWKGDLEKEVRKAFAFDTPKDYPIKDFNVDITETVVYSTKEFETYKEYQKEYEFDDEEESSPVKKYFEKGFKVGRGSFESDGDLFEKLLCECDIDYESENFIMKQDGGY